MLFSEDCELLHRVNIEHQQFYPQIGWVEHISATETALNIYLSKKLRDFHTEYPGIRLRISNHSTPQAVQAVKSGEVDFAVISTPAEVEQGLKMVELRPFYEAEQGTKGCSFDCRCKDTTFSDRMQAFTLTFYAENDVSS